MSEKRDFGLTTPDFTDGFFEKETSEVLALIGAYIKVIQDIRSKKKHHCRNVEKWSPDTECPTTCIYYDQDIPCDEPCEFAFIIEKLCDVLQDKVYEATK